MMQSRERAIASLLSAEQNRAGKKNVIQAIFTTPTPSVITTKHILLVPEGRTLTKDLRLAFVFQGIPCHHDRHCSVCNY